MIEAHLAKMRCRGPVSEAEEEAIRGLVADVRSFGPDEIVIRAGEPLSNSMLLIDGWLGRVRDLESGQRQITELHVAGDFADLHGYTLKRLDHHVVTFTHSKIAIVPHDRIDRLIQDFPHLMRLYWFSTNLDAAIHREWVVSIARRPADSRLAHMFCELHARLAVIGRVRDDSFTFPLTQEELAECAGLTSVHVNRTLQDLRARELIRLQHRTLSILDYPALRQLADFDPSYLHLEKKPI
jgi:CRP-like cAMP-binding protein